MKIYTVKIEQAQTTPVGERKQHGFVQMGSLIKGQTEKRSHFKWRLKLVSSQLKGQVGTMTQEASEVLPWRKGSNFKGPRQICLVASCVKVLQQNLHALYWKRYSDYRPEIGTVPFWKEGQVEQSWGERARLQCPKHVLY